jgi:hypothetical protein
MHWAILTIRANGTQRGCTRGSRHSAPGQRVAGRGDGLRVNLLDANSQSGENSARYPRATITTVSAPVCQSWLLNAPALEYYPTEGLFGNKVDLGIISKQNGPDRFSFQGRSPSESLPMPGDYVEVSTRNGSSALAIVEEISGSIAKTVWRNSPLYEWSCRVLGVGVTPGAYVGLPVRHPSTGPLIAALAGVGTPARVGELVTRDSHVPVGIDLAGR